MKDSDELIAKLSNLRSISCHLSREDGKENIEILQSPTEFYQSLRTMVREARSRIILSALYLGDGKLERQLIEDLRYALSKKSNSSITIELIFDHSRAQRGPRSSLDLLVPLVTEFPDNIKVYLYQMPILRSFPYNLLPGQLKEVAAVYHCKFCVCDDRVILTGANLAEEYFSSRQDRYWLIHEDSKSISEANGIVSYLTEFTEAVREDCYMLRSDRSLVRGASGSAGLQLRLQKLLSKAIPPFLQDEVCCIPLIQHQSLGIRVEEETFLSLLHQKNRQRGPNPANNDIIWKFSTPYTNFSSQLSEGILESCFLEQRVEILGPDDASHGFASASGFKSLVPAMHVEAFTSAMKSAYHRILNRIPEPEVLPSGSESTRRHHYFYEQLEHFTFKKSGWTFHAKGFWFDLPLSRSKSQSEDSDRLVGSYIGSSNFGERSWNRDFELGFLFVRKCPTNWSQIAASKATSSSWRFRGFLEEDYQQLKRQCWKDYRLNQKIAAFAAHPPSRSSKYTPSAAGGIDNNLLNIQNIKTYFHQRMISLLTRFIKPYL